MTKPNTSQRLPTQRTALPLMLRHCTRIDGAPASIRRWRTWQPLTFCVQLIRITSAP